LQALDPAEQLLETPGPERLQVPEMADVLLDRPRVPGAADQGLRLEPPHALLETGGRPPHALQDIRKLLPRGPQHEAAREPDAAAQARLAGVATAARPRSSTSRTRRSRSSRRVRWLQMQTRMENRPHNIAELGTAVPLSCIP